MKRHWRLALLACALLPGAARAQEETGWGPALRVTATLGISPALTQRGDAVVVTTSAVDVHSYELAYESGMAIGATFELRVWNRLELIAGGAWSSRSGGELSGFDDPFVYQTAGTNFWLAKAGLALRLNEAKPAMQRRAVSASIFVAPAIIRDAAKAPAFAPARAVTTVDHFGINFGAEAELPFAKERLAFTIGLEDWLIFWNAEEYAPRVGAYVEERLTTHTVSAIDPGNSHMWLLRAGLSFRF